jgi:hypothetical protein
MSGNLDPQAFAARKLPDLSPVDVKAGSRSETVKIPEPMIGAPAPLEMHRWKNGEHSPQSESGR